MARSPLTEILNRVNALAEQIHALPEDERNYLLDLLLPEQEPVKARRKRKTTAKKTSTSGNSRRGLPQGERQAVELCTICNTEAAYADHFKPSPYFHPFQPPASARRSSKSARAAVEGSSASNGEASTIVSSGDGMENASSAAHAASGE